jgi:hypothetical protein
MNLTPPALRLEWMSEVEKNKHLLSVDDVISANNGNVYQITELHIDGDDQADYIVCFDVETKEVEHFTLDLGISWWVKSAKRKAEMLKRIDDPNNRWISYSDVLDS